ncbi:MAG: hypothetical protein LBT89_02375 [Planctomycetaceae bacterium]|jgi:very-short-patch-repair endonuclease|nr:hypothetical protein [Planctomycetaceae bacterium]
MKSKPKEQKTVLFKLLQKQFGTGNVEKEKKFQWRNDTKSIPAEYQTIHNALVAYRGLHPVVEKKDIRCDFVIESDKLIIEFDERQHFSEARKISLAHYPDSVVIHFDKSKWKKLCEEKQAKDNDPAYRDEQRALLDSVRDIAAAKNGYTLLRITEWDVDWTLPNAANELKKLLKAAKRTTS